MKKAFLNFVLPFVFGLAAIIIIGSGCFASPPYDDESESPPNLIINSPNEGHIFYTENGIDQPNSLYLSSNSWSSYANITKRSIFIYNSLNVRVFDFEDLSASAEVYTTFYTTIPGEYEVIFETTDEFGRSVTETRSVTCILSESDVDTDN